MSTRRGHAAAQPESAELRVTSDALGELLQATLAEGSPLSFRAKGSSMAPFIRDGDTVCVAALPEGGPAVGDVVAFVRSEGGQLLVHRVVGREAGTWAIQGDNTPGWVDRGVRRAEILGRVAKVTRNGREVRLGLGPERRLIASLSRTGWLARIRRVLATGRPL